MHPPVESSELGPLEIVDVYLDYDGPRLFSCMDGRGQLFVAVWVVERVASAVWLYAPISRQRLNELEADIVDLRSIFSESESGKVLRVTTFHDERTPLVEPGDCSEIPEEWLPLPGASLSEPHVQ